MGIIHQLLVYLVGDNGEPRDGAVEFMSRFAPHQHPGDGGFYFANAAEAAEAAADAESLHLPSERFYQLIVHPEEIRHYPGYYLSLDVVEPLLIDGHPNMKALADVQIAKDLDSEDLWVDASLRAHLESSAIGLQMNPVDPQWFVVESISELPVSIRIPKPMFVGPNIHPAGTWIVQSDGRDCLSDEGARFLQQKGICRATHINTPEGDYVVRPRYLVSPMLLEEMITIGIRGIAERLFPLIDADRALALEVGEGGR